MKHTRPNISNAIGIVVKFQADLKETNLARVKRILRYLKGTRDYSLWYDRSQDFTFYVYTNANWVGSVDDRKKKKTSGGAFFFGEWCGSIQGCLVSYTFVHSGSLTEFLCSFRVVNFTKFFQTFPSCSYHWVLSDLSKLFSVNQVPSV